MRQTNISLATLSTANPGVSPANGSITLPAAPQETEAASPLKADRLPAEVQTILATRICDLGLRIEGSPLEKHVARLYRELQQKRLAHFHPRCYLTDEWGCPSGEPVIGIPLYLADSRLAVLERELNDLEGPQEIMMYLRHEAGHAFNYAYELYRREDWGRLFGSFRRAYRDDYRAVPFARQFVTYLPGWYAQKHPDEDFAETFAVWLTPGSAWRRKYRGTPAFAKLQYMDGIAREMRSRPPVRPRGRPDVTVDEMGFTVAEFYERTLEEQPTPAALSSENDLAEMFRPRLRGRGKNLPAAMLVRQHRKALADSVSRWTGVQRPIIRRLLQDIELRAEALRLKSDVRLEAINLVDLATYVAMLALNNLEQRRKQAAERRRSREKPDAR
ncbi:MAG: putative zinc-binding metallopeptidase [Acidobacteria bacterium]|nr:putative zinc-binding metallopeptidase [Acidobacteriota bacterium]